MSIFEEYGAFKPHSSLSSDRSKAVPLLQFLFLLFVVHRWFRIWHLYCVIVSSSSLLPLVSREGYAL